MPNSRVNMDIAQKGKIFNTATTRAEATRMVVRINDRLAEETKNIILIHLGQVLQNPTGYYESRIAVDRRQIYRGVTDSNVIYGGWLEGISSRNRTTRFKGYHHFRIAKQRMERRKRQIAAPYVGNFVRSMNS
jgi:hypothetical protein